MNIYNKSLIMNMPQQLRTLLTLCLAVALSLSLTACGSSPSQDNAEQDARWQALNDPDCKTYFDGCNTCTRDPDTGISACTRKACADYEPPQCLDDTDASLSSALDEPRVLRFRCSGSSRFTVYFGEYLVADTRLALEDSQVMFVDGATRIAEVMTEQPTASGKKYVSGTTTLWLDGERARVNKNRDNYYNNCEIVQQN